MPSSFWTAVIFTRHTRLDNTVGPRSAASAPNLVGSVHGKCATLWVNFARANCICLDRGGEWTVYVGEISAGVATNV